jgi:hypothetical protein
MLTTGTGGAAPGCGESGSICTTGLLVLLGLVRQRGLHVLDVLIQASVGHWFRRLRAERGQLAGGQRLHVEHRQRDGSGLVEQRRQHVGQLLSGDRASHAQQAEHVAQLVARADLYFIGHGLPFRRRSAVGT